jgi:MSHA pilin protein MshD
MKGYKYNQQGLTLIESVVGIVILGFALSILVSGVFSSSEKSHKATYEAQAAALGHSIMTDILSRQFDQHSDPNGGLYRCGEKNESNILIPCSVTLGRDGDEQNVSVNTSAFNDVDDFIGCWGKAELCSSNGLINYDFDKLIATDSANEYKNFTVEIQVNYANVDGGSSVSPPYKKIDITLYASQHARYTFSAYRGNY